MSKEETLIITGANRGIGASTALAFAKAGYQIAMVNRSQADESLLETIRDCGVEVREYLADVSDFDLTSQVVKAIHKDFGRVDVLVNNAGITKDSLLIRMSEEAFDQVIDVNLKGSFNLIRHVSKIMLKQRRGAIINVSSLSGIIGNIGQANYSASKAGLIGLTRSAARELASRHITVNAVAPGFISSDMTDQLSDKTKEAMLEEIPLKRFGEQEEVAEAILFLATNQYITGTTLEINGGLNMN
ncbi:MULTISPECIES: 3-oxoacyl-[acyl-carrier-protein] reductase [Aerococcus]|uniref:3-oxoacyl-[acyl-carrier-protein] reductase n=1 Tax=Aerococcus sanguinicola TaxID=119206 RepID=A0A5N1GNB9_9LACT|nr:MULTISPECIES: 3-oxoacyl-[acyl-carrier-protein] reductase [Aerococcus]KAA9301816.1 3-oxoacyl-[acyl-carrier-protein] reductase [Aerococcus sanguinicola]MDK6368764.1 3-oxoacyl-[acyl-carrier-protein] reductase [Aerococcus sp. UMB9870]MDK6679312.1 3-oxoacyl-[acyl-carrier-protein] reductase [Aerococcus sp. UMB8608]MDK6685846.1 3-oxoacyl-[acyl-carrier-protein] reductase [Aerococcus sp. UMB8623]MDK6939387.1 3-oxoacyl-[acyl-carrier-protein] reductase [Aerococcus sp. UMB8487]